MKKEMKLEMESVVAEINLVYKTKVAVHQRIKIGSSADAARFFREHWNPDTIELFEEMKILYMNWSGHAIGLYTHSAGSMTGTIADIRLILIAALRLGATRFIICHSHPSGSLHPSTPDKRLTDKLNKAAELMDIQLIDHIILTQSSYYSFKEDGLL